MPESAEEIHARISTTVGEGRLPTPSFTDWDAFPWEVEDGRIVPKRVPAPSAEGPREGEGDRPCPSCGDVDGAIWENEAWRVRHHGRTGLPLTLVLETREHMDFHELDDDLAGQFGRLSVRITRIVEAMPHIGRVHTNRWGDGCAHTHVWFHARPAGLAVTRGSFAPEWDDILPVGPEDLWRDDLSYVARHLATHGGEIRL